MSGGHINELQQLDFKRYDYSVVTEKTKTTRGLKEKYKNYRILLAIEQLDQNAPNIDERIKRKNFYTKNGFYDLNFTMTEQSVTYDMLGYNKDNKTVTEQEFFCLNKNFFGKVFYNLFYKRIYVEPRDV